MEFILIVIAAILLAATTFVIGAYMVKLWYLLPERRMTEPERKFNKLLEIMIVEDWYPHG